MKITYPDDLDGTQFDQLVFERSEILALSSYTTTDIKFPKRISVGPVIVSVGKEEGLAKTSDNTSTSSSAGRH